VSAMQIPTCCEQRMVYRAETDVARCLKCGRTVSRLEMLVAARTEIVVTGTTSYTLAPGMAGQTRKVIRCENVQGVALHVDPGPDFQREYLGHWVDPPQCGRCRRPLVRESMVSGSDRCRACGDMEKAANARDAARLAEYQAARTDPLDVEYDGVKLRLLLDQDEMRQRTERPLRQFEPLSCAQRAAVSAHWSAALRAKVAAGAAVDKAREISVVVDLEDW